jgi:hypothetical protein
MTPRKKPSLSQRSNRGHCAAVSWGRVNRFLQVAPFCVCALGLLAQDAPLGLPPTTQAPNSPYPGATHGSQPTPSLPGIRKKKKDEDLMKASGTVGELALDHFVIETKDRRSITFHLVKDTKFLDGNTAVALKDVALGQFVDVEAQEDNDEEFTAVTVHLKAQPTTVVKDADADTGEDARPKLKFGKPAETAAKDEAPDAEPAPAAPETADASPAPEREPMEPMEPKLDPHVEFLEKSRELAFTFTEGLPNYVCQELVTRYQSESHAGTLWQPQDVVSEQVVWNNNKEDYSNVQIDGKKVNPAKVGDRSWSTGEFGTVLLGLMNPATEAQFKFVRGATLHHVETVMYDFSVDQPHSHWNIHEGGQQYQPAYSGTIWFEKSSGRAMRLEFSAEDIPKEFPADTAELALDYDYVLLGQKRFLLPVHSEMLICHRGMSLCSRNDIEFRNYHKYGAESDIKFGDAEELAPALAPSAQPKPKQ